MYGLQQNHAPVIVGFTGSRAGMTARQLARVREVLEQATEAHHGDCVGGDAEVHAIAIELGVPVVIHPPDKQKHRACCQGAVRAEPERPYLRRNRDIVRACDLLVAAPKESEEPPVQRGQGTWSTVRYARKSWTAYPPFVTVLWP
jgi:hypothetical protein